MNKHVLIVESENDKFFIEALVEHLNLTSVAVGLPMCRIDDFECLEGVSLSRLTLRLEELKDEIPKDGIGKVGIIVDADDKGIEARVEEVNSVLQRVFELDRDLTTVEEFIEDSSLEVRFACYVMNVDGFGELETLLRCIKSQDSTFADCLEGWKKCLDGQDEAKSGEIARKEFDKFWIQIYQRYDCCSKQERKQAGRKCNNEASMKKAIWDFEHPVLNDLKHFLQLFREMATTNSE